MLFWICVGMMLRQETQMFRPDLGLVGDPACRLRPQDLSRSLPRLVTRQREIIVNTEIYRVRYRKIINL